jgi:hypothetical protein
MGESSVIERTCTGDRFPSPFRARLQNRITECLIIRTATKDDNDSEISLHGQRIGEGSREDFGPFCEIAALIRVHQRAALRLSEAT